MAELKHTCANNDGLRDVGHAPEPCLACDIETIGDRLAGPGAEASLDALDRISEAIATRAGGGEAERWVACSERLPAVEYVEPVWFAVAGVVYAGEFEGQFTSETREWWPASKVSHWMPRRIEPVPAPPVTHPEPGTPAASKGEK